MPATFAANTKKWYDQFWAGLALFCSMYYILTLNSQILFQIGMPVASTMLATFLVIIVFNFTGVLLTQTGLMIAPAIGVSTFVVHFVKAAQVQLPGFGWENAMLGCLIGGAGLIWASFAKQGNLRTQVIQDLPESVRKGAKAAIGSLLAFEALEQYKELTAASGPINPIFGFISVSVSVSVLFVFFLLRERHKTISDGMLGDVSRFFLRIEFILAAIIMRIALQIFEPSYINSLPSRTEFQFLWGNGSSLAHIDWAFASLMLTLLMAVMIWFIVITDIPGTPNVVLPEEIQKGKFNRAVKCGYKNDAFAALLSPVFGTATTIYYAENQILRDFQTFGRGAGLACIFFFTAILATVFLLPRMSHYEISIEWILPPFAVLPILLFIGLFIVSISFMPEAMSRSEAAKGAELPSGHDIVKSRGPQYFLPTAIAVVLTPWIGLEYAFPLSILSYWCVSSSGEEEAQTRPGHGSSFVWISAGAAAVLLVVVLMHVLKSHP
jgi:xanthine/uracil/vitamin C permease (AzgA family)